MNEKVFRPSCVMFIICAAIVNLIVAGSIYGIIYGILNRDLLALISCISLFGFMLHADIKTLTWKVTFCEDHILIPPSVFNNHFFGRKRTQKILYSNIIKLELLVRPAQILFIECKNDDKLNAIYVKQFSKKQVRELMDEIDTRIRALGLPKIEIPEIP